MNSQPDPNGRFNRKNRLGGHLFQGRYKSLVVEAGAGNYFAVLSDYIHLNPVKAFLVRPEDRLVDYRWSSYPAYAMGRESVWPVSVWRRGAL